MRYPLILPILCLLGCAPEEPTEVSRETGKSIFEMNCAVCHGADGKGSGPMAGSLGVQPADLTRISARRDGVWPMLEVMSIIDGYAKRTDPRPDMPIIAGVADGPLIAFDTGNGLTSTAPAALIAVTTYLESIQVPRPERYVP